MLSTFEAALLDRHLRRCAECSAFAASAAGQTQLLRAAALEQPSHRVVIPASPARAIRRGVVGALSAGVAAAAAALIVVAPGTQPSGLQASQAVSPASSRLAMVSASPMPSSLVDVPRLEVEPASLVDGPVRGLYRIPV